MHNASQTSQPLVVTGRSDTSLQKRVKHPLTNRKGLLSLFTQIENEITEYMDIYDNDKLEFNLYHQQRINSNKRKKS